MPLILKIGFMAVSSKDIEKLWKEYSPVSRPKKRVLSAEKKRVHVYRISQSASPMA